MSVRSRRAIKAFLQFALFLLIVALIIWYVGPKPTTPAWRLIKIGLALLALFLCSPEIWPKWMRNSNKGKATEDLELIYWSELPFGEWFRINIEGKPGLSITRKISWNLNQSGDQYVVIGNQKVWWVKNYIPGEKSS